MSSDKKVKVGSRKSELALIQTRYVISLLKKIHPDYEFEIVTMNTLGDKVLNIPLPKIGEKSLFTKELEYSLSTGGVDFVVHSLKDLPTILPDNMAIGAVLTREDPRDALVLHQNLKNHSLKTLPKGSVIGTSSLRRTAQLARKYPNLVVESIRGNLNTRLKKLDEENKFQAIILAAAGLIRMGWHNRISEILDSEELLYAVGQGALAVECRANDEVILNLLKPLHDVETALSVIAERSFLKTLEGGCSAPVAVVSHLEKLRDPNKVNLKLIGAVWSLDGTDHLKESSNAYLEIKESARCKRCPYSQQQQRLKETEIIVNKDCCTNAEVQCPVNTKVQEKFENESSSSKNNRCSSKCLHKKSDGNGNTMEDVIPAKKPKVTDGNDEAVEIKNTINVATDDPHKNCPIEIPIGADFMGKCPFLEKYEDSFENSDLTADIENCNELIMKCPFFKENVSEKKDLNVESTSKSSESNLYVGLAPHPDVPKKTLDEALILGKSLALDLMGKGAVEIMTKAHAYIRKS